MRHEAIRKIHPEVVSIYEGDVWRCTDENEVEVTIDTTKVDAEEKKLQAEFDAQEYARNRAAEYPSIEELTVALYDTDDKAAIETKRAAVKAKYPKPS